MMSDWNILRSTFNTPKLLVMKNIKRIKKENVVFSNCRLIFCRPFSILLFSKQLVISIIYHSVAWTNLARHFLRYIWKISLKSLRKYPSPLPCCVTLSFCLHFESPRELIAGEYYDIKRKKKDCKVEVTSKVRKRKQRKGLAGIRNVKRRLALVL